jgi:hypothetical protein
MPWPNLVPIFLQNKEQFRNALNLPLFPLKLHDSMFCTWMYLFRAYKENCQPIALDKSLKHILEVLDQALTLWPKACPRERALA